MMSLSWAWSTLRPLADDARNLTFLLDDNGVLGMWQHGRDQGKASAHAATTDAGRARREVPGRGLVDRRHPRHDGGPGPPGHGRGRLRGALQGAAVARDLRRCRPGGEGPGR